MLVMPDIVEVTGKNTNVVSIPTKLYQEDIVQLFGEITEDQSYSIISQLLYLDTLKEKDQNIKLYLNTPGGSIYAGNAIHDCIRSLSRKVDTIAMGITASMGSFLLASGTGERKALKNTRIMIHGASGGAQGTIKDLRINLKEIEYLEDNLVNLQVKYSNGKITKEQLLKITDRDNYMSPQEALDIGIIDSIIE